MTTQVTLILVALGLLIIAVLGVCIAAHVSTNCEKKHRLIEALRNTRNKALCGTSFSEGVGICATLPGGSVSCFLDIAKKWPKYSGHPLYPVPHPTTAPSVAFVSIPLWDLSTEYGRNRLELIDFVINQLDKKNARQ